LTLAELYNQLSPRQAAVINQGDHYALNRDNPVVGRHVSLACARMVQALVDSCRYEDARRMYQRAIDEFHVAPAALGPCPVVPPPAPRFWLWRWLWP
jgi:hypothetical protein